jgi:hypothetical protein
MRILHAGLVLVAAVTMVSPCFAGNFIPRTSTTTTATVGGLRTPPPVGTSTTVRNNKASCDTPQNGYNFYGANNCPVRGPN